MQLVTLGRLRTRIVPPPGGRAPTKAVVLLHGFGASGDDLVSLAEWVELQHTAWVFPEAPLELGGLYGDARAWWMLDLERLERDAARGRPSDRSDEQPPGLPEARALLRELLAAVPAHLGVAPERIVLGGFSQGAMLSLDVALHDPAPLAGVVLLSGTLIHQAAWRPLMPARAGTRVLVTHGTRDALLPYAAAERLRDLLVEAGWRLDWVPFEGGHEIPPPLLQELADFLGEL